MAAPNLNAPTTITGKAVFASPADTSEATILTNAASSGKAMRITSLLVSNVNVAAADATVTIYSAASGGTGYKIANSVTIPAYATLVVLSRDGALWLEEDRRITIKASAANYLTFAVSYEEVG